MSLKQDEIGKKPGLQLTNLSVLGEESEDDEGREDEVFQEQGLTVEIRA